MSNTDEFEVDENDVHEANRRAHLAKSILDNPVYKEVWDSINKQLYDAFCDCPTSNTKLLSEIRLTKSVAVNLQRHIEQIILTGKQVQLTFDALNNDKVI